MVVLAERAVDRRKGLVRPETDVAVVGPRCARKVEVRREGGKDAVRAGKVVEDDCADHSVAFLYRPSVTQLSRPRCKLASSKWRPMTMMRE